jgi:Mrp family chromosome partitioning ATPase
MPKQFVAFPWTRRLASDMLHLSYALDTGLATAQGKIIQFIGSRPGEGTTTLIRALATIAVTHRQQTVLLLDAAASPPLASPSLARPGEYELARLATQELRQSQPPTDLQATSRMVGPVPTGGPFLPAVLHSLDTNGLLANLRQRFDMILVDSPAAAVSLGGFAVARYVDGVVLVVEAENTPWPLVNRVKERLQQAGGNVLGVVLNKRRYHIPAWIYKYL